MSTCQFGHIPFNSAEFDRITKLKYEWLYEINPKAQNFRWVVRNQIMAQRVKRAIEAHTGKRILCIVGADHNYVFRDELQNEPVEWLYPLR